MWRLHHLLGPLWAFLVSVLVGGILLGVAGNCAYDALSPEGCRLTLESAEELPKVAVLGIASTFLLVGGLRLAAARSHRRHEARKAFDLIKPVEDLSPEDMGFQQLRPGEQVDTHRRPLHDGGYVGRRAIEEGSGATYTEHALVAELRTGKGFVLLGQPLDGKTRTLYEVLIQMPGYQVVRPSLSKGMPGEDAFALVDGKNVILLLEDLHEWVRSMIDLPEFQRELSGRAQSFVVASTCRDGPELKQVEDNLRRIYEEIHLKLKLTPPTGDQKGRLARSIGEDWDPETAENYPTLGSVAMERSMEAMSLRFRNLLRDHPDHADALRAMKLLTAASVQPLTHEHVEAVLRSIFGRTSVHLQDLLRNLADQSFLQEDGLLDGAVRPEPAYLRDAVTYTEGKRPEDDFFLALVDVLEGLGDAEALTSLGVSCLIGGGWSAQAIWECFNRATKADPDFPSGWLNKTALLSAGGYHEDAVKSAERAVELKPEDYSYWQQNGAALHNAGRNEEALRAYRRAVELKTDRSDTWRKLGSVYMDLDLPRDAVSAFNRSLDLGADYGYVEGWIGRAMALGGLGRDGQALRAYDRAIGIDPDNFQARFNRAGLLRKMARWEEALAAAEEAEKLEPDNVDVQVGKGETLYELAKKGDDPDLLRQAYESYDQATSLDKNHATAWSMKGVTLMCLGRYAEASEVIEQSIALRPDRTEEWFYKAQALLKMAEGVPLAKSSEFMAGMWWLCRAWQARNRFPDRGAAVWKLFQQIGYDPNQCGSDFPSLILLSDGGVSRTVTGPRHKRLGDLTI